MLMEQEAWENKGEEMTGSWLAQLAFWNTGTYKLFYK